MDSVNRKPHFYSFSLPFPPSIVYPASNDLGLGFLVCNPPVMPPVSVSSLSSLPRIDLVSGASLPSHQPYI